MIINKFFAIIVLSLSLVLLFIVFNTNVIADNINYDLKPILTKSSQENGYYKYQFHKNKIITFPFLVSNLSNKNIKVNISLNDAYSDNNGYINYNNPKPYGLLRNKNSLISSMIIGRHYIVSKLAPYQTKRYYFKIKEKDINISGDILGGINSDTDNYIKNSNGSFNNLVQYSVSVLLSNGFSSSSLKNIKLNSVYANQNYMQAVFQNSQSNIVHNYKMQIVLKKNNKIIFRSKNNYYSLVPNSLGKYNLSFSNLKSGRYLFIAKLSDNNGNHKYFKQYVFLTHTYNGRQFKNKFSFNILFCLLIFANSILLLLIVKYLYLLKNK